MDEKKIDKEELLSQVIKLYETKEEYNSLIQLIQLVPDNDHLMSLFSSHLNLKSIKKHRSINKKCLITNPKSYVAWEYRKKLFALVKNREKFAKKEEKLTISLLKKDPRNFHVWNYRRFWNFKSKNSYFNYSELHSLIPSNTPNPIDLIATDPYYEGGFNLFFKRNEYFYIKKFSKKSEFIFQAPFCGELKVEDRNYELENILKYEVSEIKEYNTVVVNNEEYLLKRWEPELAVINELLNLEPECAFLLEIKLFFTPENKRRVELIEKLKSIDKLRIGYYESLIGGYHEILVPNLKE